ncbi:MAG: HPF/RaiA family ribosome-associated protein [Planctomycetota bacterium]
MTQANPVQITFRGMPRSELVEDEVRAQVAQLERFYDRLHGCRVVIEPDERRQRTGRRFRVTVDLQVPGDELVVGRHPASPDHDDPLLAVRDAFEALTRQLQDHVRVVRGYVKPHFDPGAHGRIDRLAEDHGFLETFDGREVYFHRNSVVNVDFDALRPGAEVRFHEEEGDEGPQASSVMVESERLAEAEARSPEARSPEGGVA